MEEERDKGKRKERRKEERKKERGNERRKERMKKQRKKSCTFCEVIRPSFFLQFATFRGRLSAL